MNRITEIFMRAAIWRDTLRPLPRMAVTVAAVFGIVLLIGFAKYMLIGVG